MYVIYLLFCAGVIIFCTASERRAIAIELKEIFVCDTLDLLVNGSQSGVMSGSYDACDSSIAVQQKVFVTQNGQNIVNLLEKRVYEINSGVLMQAYQKMESPSGSSIWELERKKGIWELTVTTGGVRNTRPIGTVHEHINGSLGLHKGIKNRTIAKGYSWTDTLIELTSGEDIITTTRCKEIPSGANQYRWIFTVVNSLQNKEERWELDTCGHTLYQETTPFIAVKRGISSSHNSEIGTGTSNLFTTFMVKKQKPLVEGERIVITLNSAVSLDSSVAWMYEKCGTNKFKLKNTSCRCANQTIMKSSDSLKKYLKATSTLQVDHSEIVALARKLSKKYTSVCDKIAGYSSYVAVSIQDRNTATFSSALETLRAGFGDCGEHAVLLAALLRASGTPARVVLGLVYMESLKEYYGHAWVMAHDGNEWIFADPAHNVFPACTNRVPLLIDDSGQQMIQMIKLLGKISIE